MPFFIKALFLGGFYLTKPLVLKNMQQKIPIKIKLLSLAFH
ncbi:hypothetical protein HPHPP26_0097 [Helicobacter pylori Hp P-26]|nr:hypothetical protein HPHPP26_0097 [Helicobacter pylori Hp P-26]